MFIPPPPFLPAPLLTVGRRRRRRRRRKKRDKVVSTLSTTEQFVFSLHSPRMRERERDALFRLRKRNTPPQKKDSEKNPHMSPTHEYISKRTLSCLSLSPPPPPLSFYFTSRDDVWWSCHHFHHCTSSSPSSHFSPTPSHISLSPSLTSTCGNSSLCQTQFCFSELVPYSVGQQYQPHQKSLSRSGILMFFLLLQQNSVNRKRILINKDHFSLTRDQAGTQIIEQSRRSPNSSAIQVSCLVLWLQVAHLKEMVLINQIKNKIQNLKKRERDCFFCTVKIGPSSCLSRLSDFHCSSKENISLVLQEGGGRGQRKACIIFAGCVWRGGERGEEMEFFFLSLLVPEPCREG